MSNDSMKKNCGGYTLVEILIAIVIWASVGLAIILSMKFILSHPAEQQRRSIFQSEAARIAQTIVHEIQQSKYVLSVSENQITFVTANEQDTIVYEFVNSQLMKNKVPVPCVSQSARFVNFTLEKDQQVSSDTLQVPYVMTLFMEDDFRNKTSISLRVNIKQQNITNEAVKGNWNF